MQVGEAEVTLEVGREALLHKKAAPYRRDILLAMALASCGLASSALAQEQVMLHHACSLALTLQCQGVMV